jgi:hypothetical protein
MKRTQAQDLLAVHLIELGCTEVRFEFRFHSERKWRADVYAEPKGKPPMLIEIEGGAWIRGRHTRGDGFTRDMEKYNTAAMMGYRVLRFTPQQVESGKAKEWLSKWL